MNEEKKTPIRCHVCGSDFCITDQLLCIGGVCYDCLREFSLRAKWMMDGAETLDIAAQLVEGYAKFLRKLLRDGWELQQQAKDDYVLIIRK